MLHTLFEHSSVANPDTFVPALEELYLDACQQKGVNISELAENTVSEISASTTMLTLPDNVNIFVPSSLEDPVSYVLTEQGDWYEDEIRFLRKLAKLGMHVIDSPAGHGHISLSLAQAIGKTGKLIACIAGENSIRNFEHSIANNGFDHVEIVDGDCTDALISSQSWQRIDIFCIHSSDPINTLTACQHALQHYSPLIMLEGINDDGLNMPLLDLMTQLGFSPYHLVPGLSLLAPVTTDFSPISWDTRIFYCKHDRASELTADGFLVLHQPETVELSDNINEWLTIFQEPKNAWAQKFTAQWRAQTEHLSDWAELRSALHAFAMAHDKTHTPEVRYALLNASLALFMNMPEIMDSPSRLCSVARVCTELGRFHDAVGALNHVKSLIETHGEFSPDEPFLAASARYDKNTFDISPTAWMLCQTESQIERLSTPSAWQQDPSSLLKLAESLRERNFHDEDIKHRESAALQRMSPHRKEAVRIENSAGDHRFTNSENNPLASQNIEMRKIRKLHIGGREKHPDWEILDAIPSDIVDHIGNANDLSIFEDNTFDAIYSSHVLEHFSYQGELSQVLLEWYRVMRPGGILYASVPNLDVLCELFLNKSELSASDRYLVMRMMFGGQIDAYDFHKVGYNAEILGSYISQAGFTNIKIVPAFGLFNDTSNMEFKGKLISLNLTAVK
ncbi:MAG: methyltransferase domain-containing protein [Mariprofundus sp.]|nr:methyltransferase domain-containing protein [Mariprofundus sp.]